MDQINLGIYGGTFDPIHHGHLIIAQHVQNALSLDKIIFIPAAIPPHKEHLQITENNLRWQMLKLAIESNSAFEGCSIELDKKGISFSIDTIELIRKKRNLSRDQLYFIIGADSLRDIHTWYRPEDIFKLSRVVVVPRPGVDLAKVSHKFRNQIINVDAPLIEISSSKIRELIRSGKSIRYLVPDRVEQFIRQHKLYTATSY